MKEVLPPNKRPAGGRRCLSTKWCPPRWNIQIVENNVEESCDRILRLSDLNVDIKASQISAVKTLSPTNNAGPIIGQTIVQSPSFRNMKNVKTSCWTLVVHRFYFSRVCFISGSKTTKYLTIRFQCQMASRFCDFGFWSIPLVRSTVSDQRDITFLRVGFKGSEKKLKL